MKCVVLVAKKMDSVPIAECGGITLPAGARLVVKEEIADRMLRQYRGLLIWAETIQRDSLRCGHYQIEKPGAVVPKDWVQVSAEFADPGVIPAPEQPLQEISDDRSMAGAGKKRWKKKG